MSGKEGRIFQCSGRDLPLPVRIPLPEIKIKEVFKTDSCLSTLVKVMFDNKDINKLRKFAHFFKGLFIHAKTLLANVNPLGQIFYNISFAFQRF